MSERTTRLPDPNEVALVIAIAHLPQPVGAREATRALRSAGVVVSEATVTRLLRAVDALGLTARIGGKGRVLTEEGRKLVMATEADRKRREQFAIALDIRSLDDLVDLLRARRAVELEAARSAALRATDDEIARLESLLTQHVSTLDAGQTPRHPALEFHRSIGHASHNRAIQALTETLFDPRLDRVEQVLDVVTAMHRSASRSAVDHQRIIDGLRSRDARAAEASMAAHLDRLLGDVESLLTSASRAIVEGLMELNGGTIWRA